MADASEIFPILNCIRIRLSLTHESRLTHSAPTSVRQTCGCEMYARCSCAHGRSTPLPRRAKPAVMGSLWRICALVITRSPRQLNRLKCSPSARPRSKSLMHGRRGPVSSRHGEPRARRSLVTRLALTFGRRVGLVDEHPGVRTSGRRGPRMQYDHRRVIWSERSPS